MGSVIIGETIQLGSEHFEVVSYIGGGGVGLVYKVRSLKEPTKEYALKVLRYQNKDSIDWLYFRNQTLKASKKIQLIDPNGENLAFAPRLFRVALNSLRVAGYEERQALVGHFDSDVVILSPLARGDLEQFSKEGSTLATKERFQLVKKVLDDVLPEIAFLSKNKLVHGDISPDNILESASGRFGLQDFDALVEFGKAPKLYKNWNRPREAVELGNSYSANSNYDVFSLAASVYKILFPGAVAPFDLASYEQMIPNLNKVIIQLQSEHSKDLDFISGLEKVEEFLLAGLKMDAESRHSSFKNSFYSKFFKDSAGEMSFSANQPDALHPDLQSIKKLIVDYGYTRYNESVLKYKLDSTPEIRGKIFQLSKVRDSFFESVRAAQLIGLTWQSFEDDLAKNIVSLPYFSRFHMELLDLICEDLNIKSEKIAEALIKRHFLPSGAANSVKSNMISYVKQFPELIERYRTIIEIKKQTDQRTVESKVWASLLQPPATPTSIPSSSVLAGGGALREILQS